MPGRRCAGCFARAARSSACTCAREPARRVRSRARSSSPRPAAARAERRISRRRGACCAASARSTSWPIPTRSSRSNARSPIRRAAGTCASRSATPGLRVWPAELLVHLDAGGDAYLVDGASVPTPSGVALAAGPRRRGGDRARPHRAARAARARGGGARAPDLRAGNARAAPRLADRARRGPARLVERLRRRRDRGAPARREPRPLRERRGLGHRPVRAREAAQRLERGGRLLSGRHQQAHVRPDLGPAGARDHARRHQRARRPEPAADPEPHGDPAAVPAQLGERELVARARGRLGRVRSREDLRPLPGDPRAELDRRRGRLDPRRGPARARLSERVLARRRGRDVLRRRPAVRARARRRRSRAHSRRGRRHGATHLPESVGRGERGVRGHHRRDGRGRREGRAGLAARRRPRRGDPQHGRTRRRSLSAAAFRTPTG